MNAVASRETAPPHHLLLTRSSFRKQLACFCLLASERLRRDSPLSPDEATKQQCLASSYEFSSRAFHSIEELPLIDDILSSPETDPLHSSLLKFLRLLSSFTRLSRADFFLNDDDEGDDAQQLDFPIFGQSVLLAVLRRVPVEWLCEFYVNVLPSSRCFDEDGLGDEFDQPSLISRLLLCFENGKRSLDDVEISLCGVHVPIDVIRLIISFYCESRLGDLLNSFGLVSRDCHFVSLQCCKALTIFPQRIRVVPYAAVLTTQSVTCQCSASREECEEYLIGFSSGANTVNGVGVAAPPVPMNQNQLFQMIDFVGLNCVSAETLWCSPVFSSLKLYPEVYVDFVHAFKRVMSTPNALSELARFPRFPMVRVLRFSKGPRSAWHELMQDVDRLERFQELRLADLSLPNLLAVDTPWCIEWCEGLVNLKELAFFQARYLPIIDEDIVQSLARTVTVLTLTIGGYDSADVLPLLPLVRSPNLTYLRFYGPERILESLNSVGSYPDLYYLRLHVLAHSVDHSVLTVSFPSLKSLSMKFLPRLRHRESSFRLDPISLDLALRHLSTLQTIDLAFQRDYGADIAFDSRVRILLEAIPRLKLFQLKFRFPKRSDYYLAVVDCFGRSVGIETRAGDINLPGVHELRHRRREAPLKYDGCLRFLGDVLSPLIERDVLTNVSLKIHCRNPVLSKQIEQHEVVSDDSGEVIMERFPGASDVMATLTRLLVSYSCVKRSVDTTRSQFGVKFLAEWIDN